MEWAQKHEGDYQKWRRENFPDEYEEDEVEEEAAVFEEEEE